MRLLPRLLRLWRTWQPQPRFEPSLDPTLFARARPESVLVEEQYTCSQEYSRNPWIRQLPERAGRITVHMPYDGHKWFTRDALEDVEKRISGSDAEHEATIGHLLFVDHEETNISEVLVLAGRFGAFPIRVPVRNARLGTAKELTSDRHEHQFEATYIPRETKPRLIPLQLHVQLSDPDHSDLLFTMDDLRLKGGEADDSRTRVADEIKKFAGFRPYLTLQVHARLTLPPRAGWDSDPPLVRTIRVTLPESAALPASSVTLQHGSDSPLQIDSQISSLDWRGKPMRREGSTGEEAPRRFISQAMSLRFDQPGELFDEHEIEIEVEVEVPGELLSGTRVRLFDARGDRVRSCGGSPLTVRSVVSTRCTVVLRDAFADRFAVPFQSFAFDEIVPDELRIVDVHASLVDQLFTVEEVPLANNDKKQIRRLLIAERTDGPNLMRLWVLIEGRRHATRRESRQPWGHRYTSKFESGALHIYVRGRVRGDTRNVVEEISQLQLSLRDRFRRLKAYR